MPADPQGRRQPPCRCPASSRPVGTAGSETNMKKPSFAPGAAPWYPADFVMAHGRSQVTRLTSTRPARKLAALLSLLMILLGGPTGGAFALCLDNGGHLAIEAVHAERHDGHGAAPCPEAGHHVSAQSDCLDLPLLQSAPLTVKDQGAGDHAELLALAAAPAPWAIVPPAAVSAPLVPAEAPGRDLRLITHRTVVLLN